jgi:hypothetical protein
MKLRGKMTICDTTCQSKESCTEYETGRRNGRLWCFWYFVDCNHCGNPKIQNHCLRFARK